MRPPDPRLDPPIHEAFHYNLTASVPCDGAALFRWPEAPQNSVLATGVPARRSVRYAIRSIAVGGEPDHLPLQPLGTLAFPKNTVAASTKSPR